jgi:hypothetical protein
MADEDDEQPQDRPELLPAQVDAANPAEQRKRKETVAFAKRKQAEFLQAALRDPYGRRLLWDILVAAGTFEEKYGFGPTGAPNPEANWSYRGQKDLGLRIYHGWAAMDPEGVLSLVMEFQYNQVPRKGE